MRKEKFGHIPAHKIIDLKLISSVHEGSKKPFKCETCDYCFVLKSNRNHHIACVHEGLRPFKCKFCDKRFMLKSFLKKHFASVHEGKKPFKCKSCDKKFTLKSFLISTLLLSMKEKSHINVKFVDFKLVT